MPSFRSALVITGDDTLGIQAVRALGCAGIRVHVAGCTGGGILKLSRFCRSHERVAPDRPSLYDASPEVLARLVALAKDKAVDLVVPVDAAGGICAARLRPLLPAAAFFPSTKEATVRLLDDKWRFYEFVTGHGLPSPKTWLLHQASDAKGLPLPLIVKPLSEAFSRGIAVAKDASALAARLSTGDFPLIAQEFVPGEEVSFSLLAEHGRLLAWTMHVHHKQGLIEYVDDPRVLELGRRVTELAEYSGFADIDMRYDQAGGVSLIEHNPRLWGTFERTLGLGVEFLERGLECAADAARPPQERTPTGRCPGLRQAFSELSLPAATRAYLGRKLTDPLPELARFARRALRLTNENF